MSESVYRVTEVIGVSAESWEAAARNAVETAARTVRDLRVAEATRFDVTIQDGRVALPRPARHLVQVRGRRLIAPVAVRQAARRRGERLRPRSSRRARSVGETATGRRA
jgi:flavin-binding protein dodecin